MFIRISCYIIWKLVPEKMIFLLRNIDLNNACRLKISLRSCSKMVRMFTNHKIILSKQLTNIPCLTEFFTHLAIFVDILHSTIGGRLIILKII